MKERGQDEMGSGYGKGKMAGNQKGPQNKALAGRHSRQILRPAQASKRTASSRPALQQKQQLPEDVGLPLAVQCR